MLAQQASTGAMDSVLGPHQAGSWLLEPKLDGLRGIAVRNGDRAELFSRNHLSFNSRFPTIVGALRALPVENYVLDGEIVGLLEGRSNFAALQQGGAGALEYRVFDIIWLLGHDLRQLPIEERKDLLEKMLVTGPVLKLVPILTGKPLELLDKACADGEEGLVAKRRGSLYTGGRSSDWRKLKCGYRQELVIGGYTEPRASRSRLGALLLGYWDMGRLVYAGKVGTGFTEVMLDDLHRRLSALARPSSPFDGPVAERGAYWAEPVLVAEVAFSNWTTDGRLRHPSFLGLRPDKDAGEVVREAGAAGARLPPRGVSRRRAGAAPDRVER